MSSNNLLQVVFDGIWDTGLIVVNSIKSHMKKEEKKLPLDVFFDKVGLCNKDNEYPNVVDIKVRQNETIYKIQCPIGLGKSDFLKYEDALEIFLKKDINISAEKGYIYIK